jgi:hypothetical protein
MNLAKAQTIRLQVDEIRSELIGEIKEVMRDRERIDFVNEDGDIIADVAVGFRDPEYKTFPEVDAIVNTERGIVIQCNNCGEAYDIDLDDVELSTDDLAALVCGMYKILEK